MTSDRLPGLDGLRALAVGAVLVFHLRATWLPGGFLGVDVFFVISGFLITTLLLRERARTGRLDLPRFWRRRARRLVPALVLVVVTSTVLARFLEPDLLVGIGRQTLGALTFTTNWLEISAGTDYFHATSPQLFMTFWSLAVEEQFYLLWPFAVVAIVTLIHRRRRRPLIPVAIGVASAAAMAILVDPSSVTRAYYGTDTHLIGLMIGAALAFAWAAPHRAWTRTGAWQHLRRPLTAWALVVLLAVFVTARDDLVLTFRLGIPLASLATAVLVLALISAPTRLRDLAETVPLRWIGERSYGIYLWHWPVVLLVGAAWPIAPGGAAYVISRLLCVALTLVLAGASYRWVEQPVRRLGFRACILTARHRLEGLTPRALRLVTATGVVATFAYAAVLASAPTTTATQAELTANTSSAPDTTSEPTSATGEVNVQEVATASTSPAIPRTPPGPAELATVFAMPSGDEIDAYGDSMLVGSLPAMRYYFPGIRQDGKSNRHWSDGLAAVTKRGELNRRAVVLAFGTNAGVDRPAIEQILADLGPRRMVVLVTEHGGFSRVESDNATLREIAATHPNVALADWDAALQGTTGQLQSDGIHPSRIGQHLFAKTIRTALAELTTRHTGVTPALPELPIP